MKKAIILLCVGAAIALFAASQSDYITGAANACANGISSHHVKS